MCLILSKAPGNGNFALLLNKMNNLLFLFIKFKELLTINNSQFTIHNSQKLNFKQKKTIQLSTLNSEASKP